MSEFIWQDQYRIQTAEISRGAQFSIWRDIKRLGLLNGGVDSLLEEGESIAELIAPHATVAVYVCENGAWIPVDNVLGHPLPITTETLNKLPMTLANGWIEAALKDNHGVYATVSFPSASVGISSAGSDSKPESEA